MGSQQVDVDVFSSGRHVDGPLRRPVRVLPSGSAGVVYGGEVYPLHAGNRIDLTEDSYDKYACTEFVIDGAPIPYVHPRPAWNSSPTDDRPLLAEGSWNLESNRFGHYVVFDADEETAQAVVDRLAQSSLGVRRWDASHRPANDGRFYDWFVRLTFEGEGDECLRQVRSLVGRGETSPAAPLQLEGVPAHLRAAVLGALQKALVVARENSLLRQEVTQLKAHLTRSRAETERVRVTLTDEVEGLRNARQRHQEHIESVLRSEESRREALQDRIHQLQANQQQQLSALRQQLALAVSDRADSPQAELNALREQIVSSQRDMDELTNALEQSWDAGQGLADRLAVAEAQVASQTAEATALRNELLQRDARLAEVADELAERATAQREKASGRRRPDLQTFFDKLFRRCDLDADSIEELFKFDRTDKAVHELMRIDREDPQLRAATKKVQGYPDWWELSKINTGASGKSGMGRIYYRHHAGGVQAVVHLKKDDDEQRRFMAKRLV